MEDEQRVRGLHDAHEEDDGPGAEAAHGLDVEGAAVGGRVSALLEIREAGGKRDAHVVGDEVGDDAAEEGPGVKEGQGVRDCVWRRAVGLEVELLVEVGEPDTEEE